ncbi:extracellular solute-binding protein [Rhodococcus sp. ABRD24]|uniref:extracellular solute-binding protein n=1 Tax=Rhodococcus sp. ABRD24 TaxID=2507582 RepID=UPI00103F8E87|nr:extracellular solute-binding protein [Rhodococcus sp. ABRD24]QBJ96994.1 extracellular solute-binding protein [Rhodococcus sp. ABRD24]
MSRKVIRPLATTTVVAALLVATACSSTGTSGSGDTGPIRIVSGQSGQNGELLESLLDTSGAALPVTLEMSADSDLATAQKALLDISSGHGPDAVRVTGATYRTFVEAGAAQPVDSCLDTDPALRDDLDQDLLDGIRVDGELYQIPWYVTPNALFYNAKLFTAAGLDPNRPPTTMTEFHNAARAIAATGTGGGVAYFGNDYNFQTYVSQGGGQVYDPAGGTVGIDSDAGKAAFDLFATMAADGSSPVYTNFFQEANDAFAGGRLGMYISSASGYPAYRARSAGDIRIAPVPTIDGGRAVATTSTNGFVITTKDPERQKAVCDALLSLVTPEAVTETVSATATLPLRMSVVDDPARLRPVYEANPSWVAVRDQPTVAWAALPGEVNAEYSQAYVDTQLQVLRGDLAPADAAARLADRADQLLEDQ